MIPPVPSVKLVVPAYFYPAGQGLKNWQKLPSAAAKIPIVVIANLDVHARRGATVTLDLAALGVAAAEAFQVHDLISDARFYWHGATNHVDLDPAVLPARVLRVRRKVRTEHDFEYFL